MFQSSKFILSIPNLSFSRIPSPQNPKVQCALKRARCVTRMPCSIWPTPWMPRFTGGGEMFGWVRCTALVGLARQWMPKMHWWTWDIAPWRFLLMKDGLRDKNVERLLVDQKLTKDTSPAPADDFCVFFPIFCWKNSETGDLWGGWDDKKSCAQWKKPGCLDCIGEYISLCHRVKIISYHRNPWLNSQYNGKYSVFFFQGILFELGMLCPHHSNLISDPYPYKSNP